MTVRLGTNPIAWSNDDLPELGGETPLETCLAEARLAGFDGIELGNKFPREAAACADVLRPHGLALVSGWYGAELRFRSVADEIAAMQPHLELLATMGCPVMVFAEVGGSVQGMRGTPVADRPVMTDSEWRDYPAKIAAVADHMAKRGVRLAYHHHMGTAIEKAHEIDRLMQATPDSVGLLYDTGHLTFAGDDPAAVAGRWAGRIVHVHAKDVRSDVMRRALAERWSFLDAVIAGVFTVPGDGCVDFERALAPVARAGYAGWWIVEAEQDPARAEPLKYARMGHAHLTATAERLGVAITH
ncbi:myo-inosose-2 dehydratase [Thalassobaculum fulvum]|uniref:Myo-inosose-2 dehydratase n=1 Tax=Thalassobaculum fulvum TaxID=1633335 RepID=A0A919CSE7_9PROT|nr:myo-inosose-2 dehydratase [Thalassobaculum fulvum]GHD62103.1 myo-inosose-2 dehydratase [Thalassobaculum fulvum]